jgi:hypothetical protein
VNFNAATVVKVDGQAAKASDLKTGLKAIAVGEHISLGTAVTEIRAYTPKPAQTRPSPAAQGSVSGTITQVSDSRMTLQFGNGQTIAVNFNAATVVKVNGQAAKASDLKVAMRALAIGQHISLGTPVSEIRAYALANK